MFDLRKKKRFFEQRLKVVGLGLEYLGREGYYCTL